MTNESISILTRIFYKVFQLYDSNLDSDPISIEPKDISFVIQFLEKYSDLETVSKKESDAFEMAFLILFYTGKTSLFNSETIKAKSIRCIYTSIKSDFC